MIRPLHHLVEIEKRILLKVKNRHLYSQWDDDPIVFTGVSSKKPGKPDKINKLMVLMIRTQNNNCVLCGRPLEIDKSLRSDHPDRPSFDHVISKNKGGQDRGNRIVAHRQCNSLKSNRDPTGCELIWLMVINDEIAHQQHLFINKRKKKHHG